MSFKDWFIKKSNIKFTLTQFYNLEFDFQLGTYLRYFREHGFIIVAWYTGYWVQEILEDGSTKWHKEEETMPPDASSRYWKLAIEEGFRIVAHIEKQKDNPF
jgi:hypothetical protein